MACELFTREIKNKDGVPVIYATRQLPAQRALDLQIELMTVFGPACFRFIDDTYVFGDILALMQRGDATKSSDLIKRVVCMSVKEGEEIRSPLFDQHFNGEMMMMFKVFAFVLEANYKDFFKQGLEINELRQLEEAATLAKAEQLNSSPERI